MLRRIAHRVTVRLWILAMGSASIAACGKQTLVSAPVYTLAPAEGHAADAPAKQSRGDAGYVKPRQPTGCQAESPPKYCKTVGDCQTGDICISYTCEPACFSQCGDYPPGLPNCPSPLVCQGGVCVPPVQVTGPSTSGGTSTPGPTGGGTTGGASTGGGTTGGSGGTTGGASTTGGGATTGGPPTCTDPSLSGGWTMTSNYYIATGVANGYPGLLGIINEVANFLNTWAYAFAVPSWVSQIFNDLTGFDALFQNLNVVSDMQLTASSTNAWSYTCTETWTQVTVLVQGQQTPLQPQNGYNSPSPYQVDACMGTTVLASHDLSGAVTGLVGPLLDAIVAADCQINGCSYSSFSGLMSGVLTDLIDCSQLNDGSLFGSLAQGACDSAEQAVIADINNAIAQLPLGIGICTVDGTAPTDPSNLNGTWHGNISGTPFPGNFQATHN